MKLVYLLNEFPILTENFIIYEIQALLARNVDVRIVSLAKPCEEKTSDIPNNQGFDQAIHYIKKYSNRKVHILYTLFWLLRLLCKGRFNSVFKLFTDNSQLNVYSRFDLLNIAYQIENTHPSSSLLLSHFGPLGKLAASMKYYGLIEHKVATIFHGYDISSYLLEKGERTYDLLFKQADKLLFVSQFFANKAIKLGAPKDLVEVFHMSIDCKRFSFSPRPYPIDNIFKFITVGRLTSKKDHTSLVSAFSRLCDINPNIQLKLNIIGDGPDYQKIKDKIDTLGIARLVTLHGALQHDRVKDLLDESNVFVLNCVTASNGDEEGIPCSIMEAMALGIPVISTQHSGVSELVEHMKSGLIANENDVESLFHMMQKMIDSSELWEQFTYKARVKVEQEFEQETQSDKLLALLGTLEAS